MHGEPALQGLAEEYIVEDKDKKGISMYPSFTNYLSKLIKRSPAEHDFRDYAKISIHTYSIDG